MHPYIKRALVFAALVIAGLGLLDAEERTQHHALQSRERRAPVSSEVRWMVTPNVSLDFMPLPVGRLWVKRAP